MGWWGWGEVDGGEEMLHRKASWKLGSLKSAQGAWGKSGGIETRRCLPAIPPYFPHATFPVQARARSEVCTNKETAMLSWHPGKGGW